MYLWMMQSSPDTKHGTRLVSKQFCTEVYAKKIKKKKNALFVDFNFTVSFIYPPVLFLPTKLNAKTMFLGANSNFAPHTVA